MLHRSSMARPRHLRRGAALVSAASLLGLVACGPTRPTEPSGPATGSPTVARAASNGDLAFSRAEMPTEGVPIVARILTIGSDGGATRDVAGPAVYRSAPAWSPDGDVLAYTSPEGIVAVVDGEPALVAACRGSCVGFGAPAWSPDGARLAWVGTLGGDDGLVVATVRRPDPRLLVEAEIVGTPTWSPDGAEIAVVETSSAPGTIVVVDATSGEPIEEIDTGTIVVGSAIAWSPEGDRFAFEGREPGGGRSGLGIYVVGVDGSDPRLVSRCPDAGCSDLSPSWSPDGTMLALTRARCDDPGSDCFVGDIVIVPASGGGARAVTTGPALDCCPAWGSGDT